MLICSAEGDVQVYSSVPVITDITVAAYRGMKEEAKANVETGITHILKADDGIWGLNAYAGLLGKIDADGVHFLSIAFDTTEWFNDDACPIDTTLSAFVEDDTVYILLANALQVWQTTEAVEKKVAIQATIVQCIPYQPHQILLNVLISKSGWNNALYVLDVDTWDLQPLDIPHPKMASSTDGISIMSVAYHADNQRLLIQVHGNGFEEDGMLCESVAGAEWEKVAVVSFSGRMHLLSPGQIMGVWNGQATVRGLDELKNSTQVTLDMKGLLHQDTRAYQSFVESHSYIELRKSLTDLGKTDEESLVNHASKPDAFALYANQLYCDIVDKGYALTVDDQQADALVAEMYPIFQLLLNDDGQLVAMPTMVSVNLVTVNQELWNETFGAETPFPTTYQELFATMLEWERDFADSYPNVNMTDDWNMSTLLSRMIEQYIIACEETGQQLSFDTPIFTETAAAFAELVSAMNQERFERNANQDGVTMFSTCNLSQLLQMNGDMLALQPFQMDADDPAVRVDVVVLVGNSATQYPDETQELITHLSQPEYLSYETQYALFVPCNQPLTYTQGKTERSITLEGIEAYQSLLPLMKLSADSCYLSQSDSESSFTSSIQTYMQQFVTEK